MTIPSIESIARNTSFVRLSTKGQKLEIPYEFPDLNQMISDAKEHWSKYAEKKRGWTMLVCAYAHKLKPVEKPVHITFKWFCKNRRKDPDNIASGKKFILDGLVTAKILQGDGWNQITGFTDEFYIDDTLEKGRVEVWIKPTSRL